MNNDLDLVSFQMLVASEIGAERDLLRECAAKAALPVDCTEVAEPIDPAAIRQSVLKGNVDFIFLDSQIAEADRRGIYDTARSAEGRPLMIMLGLPGRMQRQVLKGAVADGLLTRPFGPAAASAMIDGCARARLPKQVLLVESSATVRAVVRKVLQASCFRLEVVEAADGDSAVGQAAERRFDLVLLDCAIGGLDSFTTLYQLKHQQSDLNVVMTTATRDTRLEDRARASRADDFLFKPFYAGDIDAILRRAFGLVATD